VIKKGEHVLRFPTSGRVVIISKDDKRFCKHENVVNYCIRGRTLYQYCLDCHNMLKQELPEEEKISVLKKIKNKLKR
jgi:hypothetical protein